MSSGKLVSNFFLTLMVGVIYFVAPGVFAANNVTSSVIPDPRIVAGSTAKDGQFPYQVALNIGKSFTCGGSIISSNYVVTAAHCVSSGIRPRPIPASRLNVRVGSRFYNSGGEVVGISEVKIHPSYRRSDNDIALLKLSKPLEFSDNIKNITIARKAPADGTAVVTSGWGLLRNSGSTPNELQYTTMTALSHTNCRRRLWTVSGTVLCLAPRNGNGVCGGDSGGPAVYNNELVGVTNFVVGGCGSRFPDGYANVAYHYSFIKNNSDL
ncbi:trypsin delta-like [Musca vetustissima]|uniref:trypsin delta-like n=1 Tax=Musca vetustissima TaxID=27455 RepID=UPI002AB7517A|nr:trypsin delta-like [Musca vetustissima]